MKRRAGAFAFALFLAVSAQTVCANAVETTFSFGGTPSGEVNAETVNPVEAQPEWTYPISREILADELDVIRLVNKQNLLDKEYPPEKTLVKATVRKTSSSTMTVRDIVADALTEMFAAAEADSVKLYLHSAYRSYRTQSTMYANRLERIGKDDGVVQMPGASDHQTGLGVDIISKAWISEPRLNTRFASTKEAQWMAENCFKFGFVVRYPEGEEKQAITGIMYEPWHLRYVGIEVATYMTQNALTLEEFTEEYRAELLAYDTQSQWNTETVVDSINF